MLRKRYRRITFFFARVILGLIFWDLFLAKIGFRKLARRTRPDRLYKIAHHFRSLATGMGGVMIKVGQFLSSRVDVLPEVITTELANLQDEVAPETFDDIVTVCKAMHNKEPGLAGFINENHHGWTFPPYLQAFGGDVFRDPPDDLMPVLDTPEAAEAAEFYGSLLREYGPDGVLSYNYDQAVAALVQGRANYMTFNHAFILAAADPAVSKVADTVAYSLMPGGPKGQRPGLAVHAFGIPVGSRKKDAAWEFIKWSLDKKTMQRVMNEKG